MAAVELVTTQLSTICHPVLLVHGPVALWDPQHQWDREAAPQGLGQTPQLLVQIPPDLKPRRGCTTRIGAVQGKGSYKPQKFTNGLGNNLKSSRRVDSLQNTAGYRIY